MNYFDPERPKLANDLPCVLGHQSHIPGLFIYPSAPGLFNLSVMLPREYNGYSHFGIMCSAEMIPGYLAMYEENPEHFFSEVMGWIDPRTIVEKTEYKAKTYGKPKPTNIGLSLEDLF